ncbi:putative nuclease HARBI1 [Macrobrachium nipponense]|uniref:putative nuclease HARBI1 n=1 Tax=Macrobrachium nipponense TaxID=159736 RepID=UPI0030C7D7EE
MTTFLKLLDLVAPHIQRKDTISPRDRLAATLRYLATGRSYEDLKFSVAVSPQALGCIIPETCEVIWKVLRKEYMKFPHSKEEWFPIGQDFEEMWQFPNCLGAVDGKHVAIVPPPNLGSFFYNYKGFHSMVFMVVVSANYEFILCDFGTHGRISDGGVIENTKFGEKLANNTLNIPDPVIIRYSNRTLPFALVDDDAFAMRPNFLKPFSHTTGKKEEQVFNYRLSRSRRIVESTFGILASKFRIFHSPLNLDAENAVSVVKACCMLHNFLRRERGNRNNRACNILFDTQLKEEMEKAFTPLAIERRHITYEAKEVRNLYLTYFNQEGWVDWLDDKM